jgi:DNA-binding response OmpR family regulator
VRVLVVEDEPRLLELVEHTLLSEGYSAEGVEDGAEAYERARTGAYNLILLDVMLPSMSGLEISLRLRRDGVDTPIVMLTARQTVADRVAGLDAGADDYLIKPFALDELLARMRAVLRRRADSTGPHSLQVDDLWLDRLRHVARRGERQIELTAREFALLDYLMSCAGQVVSRDQIIHAVWPQDFEGGSNVVDTYVHYLREKIDRSPARRLIRTVRGVGYVLEG